MHHYNMGFSISNSSSFSDRRSRNFFTKGNENCFYFLIHSPALYNFLIILKNVHFLFARQKYFFAYMAIISKLLLLHTLIFFLLNIYKYCIDSSQMQTNSCTRILRKYSLWYDYIEQAAIDAYSTQHLHLRGKLKWRQLCLRLFFLLQDMFPLALSVHITYAEVLYFFYVSNLCKIQ